MDKLRLSQLANDELQPDLKELAETISRLSILPGNYIGRNKVQEWLSTMSKMSASDELSETQARQLLFDLESSYNEFNRILHEA